MQVVGHADVDEVDVVALDQAPPVGLDALVAPDVGERPDLSALRAATAFSTGRCSSSGKKFATWRQALECALAMKP